MNAADDRQPGAKKRYQNFAAYAIISIGSCFSAPSDRLASLRISRFPPNLFLCSVLLL